MIDAATDEDVVTLPDVTDVECGRGRPPRVARGLWIGRIFVRASFDDEAATHVHTGRRVNVRKRWVLDLPGTQISLARCHTLDVALQMADEISRNAPDIHDARTMSEIESCVSPSLARWLTYAMLNDGKGEPTLSYRDWVSRHES